MSIESNDKAAFRLIRANGTIWLNIDSVVDFISEVASTETTDVQTRLMQAVDNINRMRTTEPPVK